MNKRTNKEYFFYGFLMIIPFFFLSCTKEITEPKHLDNGQNVVYVKLDGKEYLLNTKNYFFNKNTASNLDDQENYSLVRYFEGYYNSQYLSYFYIDFKALNEKKAPFESGLITIDIDPKTEKIAFSGNNGPTFFKINGITNNVDSIYEYKVHHWDKQKRTFSFSAIASNKINSINKPVGGLLYYYFDIKY